MQAQDGGAPIETTDSQSDWSAATTPVPPCNDAAGTRDIASAEDDDDDEEYGASASAGPPRKTPPMVAASPSAEEEKTAASCAPYPVKRCHEAEVLQLIRLRSSVDTVLPEALWRRPSTLRAPHRPVSMPPIRESPSDDVDGTPVVAARLARFVSPRAENRSAASHIPGRTQRHAAKSDMTVASSDAVTFVGAADSSAGPPLCRGAHHSVPVRRHDALGAVVSGCLGVVPLLQRESLERVTEEGELDGEMGAISLPPPGLDGEEGQDAKGEAQGSTRCSVVSAVSTLIRSEVTDATRSSSSTSFNPITRLGSQPIRLSTASARPPTPVPVSPIFMQPRVSVESSLGFSSLEKSCEDSCKGSTKSPIVSSPITQTEPPIINQDVTLNEKQETPQHRASPENATIRLDTASSSSCSSREDIRRNRRRSRLDSSSSSSSSEWSAILEKVKALSLTTANERIEASTTVTDPVPVRIEGMPFPVNIGVVEQLERMPSVGSCCCRICQNCTSPEILVSPCRCKGSLAYVHLSCLERWLNQSGRTYCELCQFHFNAIQTPRYRLWQSIRLWYCHPRHRRQLFVDTLIAVILTCVTLGLVSIIILGMRYFILEGAKLGISSQCTQFTITFFLAVVTLGYAVTMYLLVKDQIAPWLHWWRTNVDVRVLLDASSCRAVMCGRRARPDSRNSPAPPRPCPANAHRHPRAALGKLNALARVWAQCEPR